MKRVDLNRYSSKDYKPGGLIKRIFWYIINSVIFKSTFPYPLSLKIFFLRLFGAKIGNGVIIKPEIDIKYPWFLEIGNYTWIGQGAHIDNLVLVKIGNNVCVSQGAAIFTGNHNYKLESFDLVTKAVIIEDGVWLGAKSIVCLGVIIKEHSVVTVGSVVTHDMEAYKIYQGNPAKAIRNRIIE